MQALKGLVHSLVVFLFSVVLAASEEQQRQFDYFALVRCELFLVKTPVLVAQVVCCVSLFTVCTEDDSLW